MVLKKRLIVVIIILGGLIMAGLSGLSACGLNKDSREWIEKNRVSDIYKVYPTKDPEDLFKVFPDGFTVNQIYETNKEMYKLSLEGNPKTKEISGQFLKSPYDENKLSDVIVQNGQIILTNPTVQKDWPVKNFLFQHLAINQKYISNLSEKEHSFNGQTGDFSIKYYLEDPTIAKLLDKSVTHFEISGFGKDYYFRSLTFTFADGSKFTEQIHRPYN